MTTNGTPRTLIWRQLYDAAILQSDQDKFPPLLDDAINAVLDQIEKTITYGELEELNNALNGLRARRKAVNCEKKRRADNSDEAEAA
jgi:hypothetical protein